MASRFSLEAILKLTDNLTGPYRNSTRKITALNRGLQGSFGRLNRGINRTIKFVGKGILRAGALGLGALAAGTGLAAREFIKLEDSVTQAGAKFKDLDSTASTYEDTLKQLSDTSRAAVRGTEILATDAAGGLDKMAMAGFTSAQSMALLAGTVDLVTASGADMTTAVDIATDTLGAFNLVTEDTVQLQKNLSRVSDVMAKTTTTSNTSLIELFESVKSGAATFTAAGQSIEDFSALAGVMANAGVKGSESGTALRNVMLRLSKPTGEAADVIKTLGVQTQDSEGNFRNIIDILGDFEKGLGGMGTAQRTAALSTVFGARAVTGVNILLAEGADKLADYRDSLIESGGASRTMADAMRKSIGNRLKVLRSGLTELGLQFIDAFQTKGKAAIDKAIEAVKNFDMQKVIDAVEKTVDFFRRLFIFVKKNKGAIKGFITVLVAFKLAVIAVNVVQAIQLGLMAVAPVLAFIKVIMSLAKSEGILKTAQLLLNLAMTANPIGLIIAGITLLIAAGILLVKNWDKVKAFFISMWAGIKKAFSVSVDFMKRVMFTFADIILTTYGNIFKAIIRGAAKVGKFLGLDTSGLDAVVGKIEKVQASVREQSFIGGRSEAARSEVREVRTENARMSAEDRQRHDIFLHGPSGAGISTTPGGAPGPAVSLGGQ